MNDRELLELAAKACGFKLWVSGRSGPCRIDEKDGFHHVTHWNPLEQTDIGRSQCLQMEIDLRLTVEHIYEPQKYSNELGLEDHGLNFWRVSKGSIICGDRDRQRASTMAAAELGSMMG